MSIYERGSNADPTTKVAIITNNYNVWTCPNSDPYIRTIDGNGARTVLVGDLMFTNRDMLDMANQNVQVTAVLNHFGHSSDTRESLLDKTSFVGVSFTTYKSTPDENSYESATTDVAVNAFGVATLKNTTKEFVVAGQFLEFDVPDNRVVRELHGRVTFPLKIYNAEDGNMVMNLFNRKDTNFSPLEKRIKIGMVSSLKGISIGIPQNFRNPQEKADWVPQGETANALRAFSEFTEKMIETRRRRRILKAMENVAPGSYGVFSIQTGV